MRDLHIKDLSYTLYNNAGLAWQLLLPLALRCSALPICLLLKALHRVCDCVFYFPRGPLLPLSVS